MNKLHTQIAAILSVGLLTLSGNAFAGEKPPVNAIALSEIVKIIEDQGYTPITEISIDNGVWEAEVYKGVEKRELKVSPIDGNIISDLPDH
ncbi:PepSY domain-containing protein [Shewanella holmiensis]|uniref:PepSY domain-containing protein n=1 Tax=Shewanella holmiensis TaxID=2952222 RepID=A0A9X2WLH5_9GAMM|nr:PepSY domain-containing protein [Shewanella holmiensis]MCT7941557.1 PepSY domain-containing protein [Shewanella holmiensis]